MSREASNPCRYCGKRLAVAPGYDRESERIHHERRCPLSVDCGYCRANVGEKCRTRDGKPSPTHQSRDFL